MADRRQKVAADSGAANSIPVKGAIPNEGVVPGVANLGGDTLDGAVDVSSSFGEFGFHPDKMAKAPGSQASYADQATLSDKNRNGGN